MRKVKATPFKPNMNYFNKIANSEADRTNAEYKHWVNIIKAMHGYRCCICGEQEPLEIHHIDSFTSNEHIRTEPSNGACLCKKHHSAYHNKYKEATKANWEKFLKEVGK